MTINFSQTDNGSRIVKKKIHLEAVVVQEPADVQEPDSNAFLEMLIFTWEKTLSEGVEDA